MNKKSIAGPIIIIIALGVILVVEAIVVGTMFSKETIRRRYLLEASLISLADKVETYARSLLRAVDLSSLQGIDAFGSGSIILPTDFHSTYSAKYSMPYWQIYGNKKIPPKNIMTNKARQEIAWVSSCYMDNYLEQYDSFSQGEVRVWGSPRLTVDYIKDDKMLVNKPNRISKLSLEGSTKISGEEYKVNRDFTQYSEIDTNLGKIIEHVEDMLDGQYINHLIKNETAQYYHDKYDYDKTNDALAQLAADLSNAWGNNIKVELNIPTQFDLNVLGTSVSAIVNVAVYDNRTNYSFYDFSGDDTKIGYLGVNFLVLAGDYGDYSDIKEAQAVSPIQDCDSGLKIISSKNNICDYFNVTQDIDCDDPDGLNYDVKGVCEDFTGSYADECVGDTLYEYYCQSYGSIQLCNYTTHDCEKFCSNGACMLECAPQACQDLLDLVLSKIPSICGDGKYDPVADVNKDTKVELSDINVVTNHCGDGAWCQNTLNNMTDICPHTECVDSCPPGDTCEIKCGQSFINLSTATSQYFKFTLNSPKHVYVKLDYSGFGVNYNLYTNWTTESCPLSSCTSLGCCGPELSGAEQCDKELPSGTYYIRVNRVGLIGKNYKLSLSCEDSHTILTGSCNQPIAGGCTVQPPSYICSQDGCEPPTCDDPTPWCNELPHASVTHNTCSKTTAGCHCAGGGMFCAFTGCKAKGLCIYTCETDWYNYDGDITNGCEYFES